MSLYPLLPLIPLPLFHTPGPFQKGRADAFIIFPSIDTFESSHAATANSPLQRGWGYVSISSTPSSFFIPPAPFKRGGLTRSLYSPDKHLRILPRRHRELPSSEGLGVCLYIL